MDIYNQDRFLLSDNKNYLDIRVIYNFLHNEAYWSKGIPLSLIEKSIKNSICFGVYKHNKKKKTNLIQIGFGRIITDLSTFAYFADVFIIKEYRGLNLGKFLVENMINYESIHSVRKLLLATEDAHGLYRKLGFKIVEDNNLYMDINKENPYKN